MIRKCSNEEWLITQNVAYQFTRRLHDYKHDFVQGFLFIFSHIFLTLRFPNGKLFLSVMEKTCTKLYWWKIQSQTQLKIEFFGSFYRPKNALKKSLTRRKCCTINHGKNSELASWSRFVHLQELDPVTLHNQALMNMEANPTAVK